MPRFVTVKKKETEKQQAVQYVRNSLVYPSALMGLISIILGYGGVIYLIFKDRPMTAMLTYSLILLCSGIFLGLTQGIYQHYILRKHWLYFADRIRRAKMRISGRFKKMGDPVRLSHPGRWAVPVIYLIGYAGVGLLIFFYSSKLNIFSAIFLLLAGFHNARFFYLKRLVKE